MEKLYRYRFYLLGLLALLLFLCCIVTPLRNWFSGQFMLFTQRSVQTLQGALLSGSIPFLKGIWLSFFQSTALFWFAPRQIIAAAFSLGPIAGALSSVCGFLLSQTLWYSLGYLCFAGFGKNLRQKPLLANHCFGLALGGLWLFGGRIVPIALLCGAVQMPYGKTAASLLFGQIALIGIYSLTCSPYQSLLSVRWQTALSICGVIILLLTVWHLWRTNKHKASSK